jgi:hypothetical protein
MNQRKAIPASRGELKWYACPIGGTFFDEWCLLMIGLDRGPWVR